MKPAAFDYVRAESAAHAAALLSEHGEDARILAGGQSLMAILNMRLAQPSLLIDISQCAALATLNADVHGLHVGAAVTQSAVEWRNTLAREVPLLAMAMPHISHFQIKNRGTVCGSVAHADPSAELPMVLLALEGDVTLQSSRSERVVAAKDFFTGMLSTSRRFDEVVTAVRYPMLQIDAGYGFVEFSRRHGDYAVCAVAAIAKEKSLRIVVGGVADRPTTRDYSWLSGDALADALNDLAWSLDARDGPDITAANRRHLVRRLGAQAVAAALADRTTRNLERRS